MPERFIARLARSAGYLFTSNAPADWFGPQAPLPPAAPPEVAGRQFDYPFGFNLAVTPRGWEPTGFAELRALADAHDLLRLVIETRKDQLARLTWRIRQRDGVGKDAAKDPRIAAIAAFFARPDRVHSWAGWLRPSFLYVCYVMILAAIPMGVLWAFAPTTAAGIATGLQRWLAAIPDPVWQLFTVGYLGYTGGRSWEKIKGASK
jgi:hypothetical protein